jgi:hypothetical protein
MKDQTKDSKTRSGRQTDIHKLMQKRHKPCNITASLYSASTIFVSRFVMAAQSCTN